MIQVSWRAYAISFIAAIMTFGAARVIAPAVATHNEAMHREHGEHGTYGIDTAVAAEAVKEYEAAMHKMHKEMSIPYTGDVDVDFVRGMVPHHQGAIDQAKVLLKYSKDARLKRLALGIIATQTREMRFMNRWLREHDTGVKGGESPAWLNAPPPADDDAAPQ